MNSSIPPPLGNPSVEANPASVLKSNTSLKRKLLVTACILFGVTGIGLASATWWYQYNFNARRFQPVQLSLSEQAEVERKLSALDQPPEASDPAKTIVLNEREINGFLQQQGMGETIKVSLTKDGIGATVLAPVDESVPLLGGQTLRLKVAFNTKLDEQKKLTLSLADVSVSGISLPNSWLGNLKGLNLLDSTVNSTEGGPLQAFAAGIKSLTLRNGEMRLVLND